MKRNITRGLKKALALGMAALMAYLPVSTAIPEVFADDTYSITISYDKYIDGNELNIADGGGNIIGGATVTPATEGVSASVKWDAIAAGTYTLDTTDAVEDKFDIKKSAEFDGDDIKVTNAAWNGSLETITKAEVSVPIELAAEATLTNVTVNNTAETGITYDATNKKIVIPQGTKATAEINVTLEFTLPVTKKADGATPMETVTNAGTTVIKYSYSYQAGSVGDLLKGTDINDVKLTPVNIGDADKGKIEFYDEYNLQITDADALARLGITYSNNAWKADTDGFQYYRSPSSDYTGAEITISPKPGYQYGGSTLDYDATKNEDGSVVLKVKDNAKVTIIIKPIPVDMPENALEWTDEFETGYNSKGRTVEVSLTPTPEEAAKNYTLKWARAASTPQMIETLTWNEVTKNADGKYTFDVNYDVNEGEQTYIIYRYSNGVSDSGAKWNTDPVKFDIVNPSLAKCWVEANGETVWEEVSGATQALAWINKQQNQCVIRLQGEDNQSGVEKVVYSIYDGTGTPIQSNVESTADANGVCSISYTADMQGDIANFPIKLEYEIYDKAGNTTGVLTKTLSDMISFDFTLPELGVSYTNTSGQLITNLNQWQTEDVLVTITATDPAGAAYEQVSGIDRLQIIDTVTGVAKDITTDAVRRPDGTYQLRLSTDAIHQLSIVTYDKAGNKSTESKAEVKLDKSGIQNARVTLSTVSQDADASQFADAFTVYAQAEAVSGIKEMIFYVYENGTNRLLKEQTVTDFQVTGNLAEASFRYEPASDEENGYVVVRFLDNAAKSVTEGNPHVVYSEQKPFAFNKNGANIQIKGNTAWTNEDVTLDIQVESHSTTITSVIYYVNNQRVKEVSVNALSYEDHAFKIQENSPMGGTQVEIVAVCGANAASRIETRASIIVYVDKQAPTVQLSGIRSGAVYNTNQTLQIVTNENIWNHMQPISVVAEKTLDGVTTTVDMGAYAAEAENYTARKTFTEDGVYEVTVTAVDAAGNRAVKTISFTIDKTAPVISMRGASDGAYSSQPVTIQFQAIESFYETNSVKVTIERVIDGATYNQTLNFTNTGKTSTLNNQFSEDGDYTITMTAVDRAGNAATVQKLSFTVDCTAPTVTLTGTKDYVVTQKAVMLSFVVTESYYKTNQVEIQASRRGVDGKIETFTVKGWNNAGRTSSLSQEFKEDGYYTITITARDKAGNSKQQTIHFTIDTQPPVIGDLSQYDGKYLSEFELGKRLENLITELTVPTVKMTLNGEAYDGGKIIADGKYTLVIEVTDEVGLTASKTIEFVIDTIAPKIIFAGAENRKTYTEPVNLNLSLENESDTIVSILINGEPYELTDGKTVYDLAFDTYGSYEVVVNTIDAAGNENSQTIKFTYAKHKNVALLFVVIGCGGAATVIGGAWLVFKKKRA